jgi:hypothetical protein
MTERYRVGRAALPRPDDSDNPVARGREAWQRRKADACASWQDWLIIGEALVIGREWAMAKANGKPGSRHYNVEFGEWLRLHGFDDIDKSDRSKLVSIMQALPKIEAWRATLTEGQRLRLNSPSAVWRAFLCPRRGRRWVIGAGGADVQPRNVSSIAPGLAGDNDVEALEVATPGRVLVAANKAVGVAKDIREFSGELSEVVVRVVREAADAWAATANEFEKRLRESAGAR